MGYIKKWNIADIGRQINEAYYVCTDKNLDGFSTWGVKQDLYQIKWLIDDVLKKCPTFAPEEQWLKEQEQKRLLQLLRKTS